MSLSPFVHRVPAPVCPPTVVSCPQCPDSFCPSHEEVLERIDDLRIKGHGRDR